MKKSLSLLSLLVFLSLGSSVAWADTGTVSVDTQIDGQAFNQANAEVQNIEVKFCENDSKTKQYSFPAGEKQDICLEISNSADKDILMSMDFVDGALTNDQWKNRACMGNTQKEKFGQYISGIENSFVISAKDSVIKHAILTYPKGTTGNILGCLVYYTKGVSLSGTTDFSVLVRRAKFIDITITKSFRSLYKREIIIIIAIILLMVFLKYVKSEQIHSTKKHKK